VPFIKRRFYGSVLITAILILQAGCQFVTPTPDPTPTPEATRVLPTPTPFPIGSQENPALLGFVQPEDNSDIQAAVITLTDELTTRTGYTFGAVIYPNSVELMEEMKAGVIQAAWLQPLTYLYAKGLGAANVGLLTNHFGVYYYGSQFLANTENGFTSYFDSQTNTNTTEIETALGQFDGLRPCWVDPGSVSGYIVPLGLLKQSNLETLPGAFVQSQTAVIRSLYIKGICDFGVTFSHSGDPRTSSAIVNDLPDAAQRVVIIYQSDAVIPNLNFSVSPVLPENIRNGLVNTLLDLVKTDSGKELLTRSAGNYEIQDLRVVDDSVYDNLRQVISFSGIDIADWVGR